MFLPWAVIAEKCLFVVRVECNEPKKNHRMIQQEMKNANLRGMKHVEMGKGVSESDRIWKCERTRNPRLSLGSQ